MTAAIIDNVGFIPLAMMLFLTLIVIIVFMSFLAKRLKCVENFGESIKNQLMWSSILRSLLQGYLLLQVTSMEQAILVS